MIFLGRVIFDKFQNNVWWFQTFVIFPDFLDFGIEIWCIKFIIDFFGIASCMFFEKIRLFL